MNRKKEISARWALAGLSLCLMLSALGTSSANVALPTLAKVFDASFAEVQWVVVAYLLAITLSLFFAGRLGDLAGRRRLLLAGIFVFAAASLAAGAASGLGPLIAARAAQGVGAALMTALAMAMAGETVPRQRIGSAMGVLGAVSAIGTALGPPLGGWLIAGLGWRAIFLLNLPLGLVAFALVRGIASQGAEAAQASRPARLAPLLDKLLGGRLAASLLVAAVMMATLVVGPFYLARTIGLEPAGVGLAMMAGPLAAALTGLPAGRLVDRFGHRRVALGGLAGITAGSLAFALLPATAGLAGYLLPLVVLTSSYAAFQAANNSAVLAGSGPENRGSISGLLNLSRHLGLVVGAAAMGAVFAFGSGASDVAQASPEAVAAGLRTTFAVAAVAIGGALLAQIFLPGRRFSGREIPLPFSTGERVLG